MKWVTRERVKVDRVACPWLIKRFIDPEAEFKFVPGDSVLSVAEGEGAIPFDVAGVELGHHDGKCSFEAMVAKYQIGDPAISLLSEIVHGADVTQDLYGRVEAPGLKAVAEGFRHLGFKDDHEILAHEFIVYDALYAYCQHQVANNKRDFATN
ncbi:MAG TPA: chromate resistance protein ChrB domain-containing protein [Blastocatellia bacterium]|nr:chromate resistance protein ChrB domain-containing protein [Blastocatellia bacterium]